MGKLLIDLLIGLFCISLLGCADENDKIKVISLNPSGINDFKQKIEIKSITKLETKDSSVIGYIQRLEFYQGHYFLLDNWKSRALYIFDSDGKFIVRTKYGRGPEELIDPWDFFIDKTKKEILIWDQMLSSMRTYDMDLNLKSSKSYKMLPIRNFKIIGKDTIFVFAQSPVVSEMKEGEKITCYNYLIYTHNFSEVTQRFLPYSPVLTPITLQSPICLYNGIEFIAPYDQHIYRFENQKVDTMYFLDFGKYNVTSTDISKGLDYLFEQSKKGYRIGSFDDINENDIFLSFNYYYNDTSRFVIHSKTDSRNYYSNNMIKNKLLPRCRIKGMMNNSFIAIIEPMDLIDFLSIRKDYSTLVQLPDPLDNPYIMIFNISEN